jgi:hypothetical protein
MDRKQSRPDHTRKVRVWSALGAVGLAWPVQGDVEYEIAGPDADLAARRFDRAVFTWQCC